jgi:pilus assembly protein CpaB
MNRRNRHLVVLAIAIVTASLASLGVYRATASMPSGSARPAQVPVIVAARALAIGTPLTEADVKVVQWPANSVVPGAIGEVKDVVNRGLLTAVLPNEPITANKLADSHAGSGLPPAIPPGMRAMAVKVNDVIGVAGFIVPGSRVDVVVTIRRTQDSVTHTVVSNVQVLTAGTRRDQEKPVDDAKAAESTVVTLMVTPVDAEKIALAQSEGQIMLALRNPLDKESPPSPGVRTGALLAEPAAPAPAPAPAPRAAPRRAVTPPVAEPAAPAPYKVEALRGGKRTEETLSEGGKEAAKEPGKEVIIK